MTTDGRLLRGALLHAKHAYMPNSLGYCGPDDRGSILEHLHDSSVTPGLLKQLRAFEAAYPFIELIGRAAGRDAFEYPVPEAYWIGNELLDQVQSKDFYSFTHSRLPGRDPAEVRRVFRSAGATARPHHTFHVMSTYATSSVADGPSLTTEGNRKIQELVDNCRISWGRVKRVGKGTLVVEGRPMKLVDGVFSLDEPVSKTVKFDRGVPPFGAVKPGDWVTVHWNFACDVIKPVQVRNAEKFTMADIATMNRILRALHPER